MKNFINDPVYKLKEDVVYRIVDDEAIILDVARGEHFSLNKTGTEILKFLDEKKSIQELLNLQVNKYGKKTEIFKTDIECFIDELLKNDIIEKEKNRHEGI